MPAASSGVTEGLVLATGALALAAVFAWKQWAERTTRDEDLSGQDRVYFARKDRRRFVGTSILALISAGMFAGLWINPKAGLRHGQAFVWIWMSVGLLVCVALVLAFGDWRANLVYANRHRKALIEERRALAEEQERMRSSPANGQNGFHA